MINRRSIFRFLWLMVIPVLLGMGVMWSVQYRKPSQPRIHVTPMEFDLGDIYGSVNNSREVPFTIHNLGRKALVISGAQVDCSCMTPRFTKSVIPEGGESTMVIGFDVPAASAPIRHAVVIATNDPVAPYTRVMIKGTVVRSFDSVPRNISMRVDKGGETEQVLTLIGASDDREFRVSDYVIKGVPITVASSTAGEVLGGRRRWIVTLKAHGDEEGTFSGSIAVLARATTQPILTIPVTVQVISPVQCEPAIIILDAHSPERPGSAVDLDIRWKNHKLPRVRRIEAPNWLRITEDPPSDAETGRFRIAYTGSVADTVPATSLDSAEGHAGRVRIWYDGVASPVSVPVFLR